MHRSRREFIQLAGLTGASAALAGCEAASDALIDLIVPAAAADFAPPLASEIDEVSHVVNRLTFGPRPGHYQRLSRMGAGEFIRRQLEPEAINDRRCDWKVAPLEAISEPTAELYEYSSAELLHQLTRAKLLRAVYSQRQLLEVMVDFWTDHFSIFSSKGQCKWLKAADDRDVIRRHALGRFRDLVGASATSPAMLIYLDGHDNKVVHAGDRPNENYARELMELHTLGVSGGYTQQDVMEVARCLSGWTFGHRFMRNAVVEFEPLRHDDGAKLVLGRTIAAGGGERDLQDVLDIVCAHPATATHIATRLCRRFIADPPPESAVRGVADAFNASGGDIRRTLGSLFESEEFRSTPETRGGLFKRPLHFVVSALRASQASTNCDRPVIDALQRMGQPPFQYPTPDGYPLEQQPWLGTLLWRWNFALALQHGRVNGTSLNVDALVASLGGREALAAHFLGRRPRELERSVINESDQFLALLLASPAFQRF